MIGICVHMKNPTSSQNAILIVSESFVVINFCGGLFIFFLNELGYFAVQTLKHWCFLVSFGVICLIKPTGLFQQKMAQ